MMPMEEAPQHLSGGDTRMMGYAPMAPHVMQPPMFFDPYGAGQPQIHLSHQPQANMLNWAPSFTPEPAVAAQHVHVGMVHQPNLEQQHRGRTDSTHMTVERALTSGKERVGSASDSTAAAQVCAVRWLCASESELFRASISIRL